MSVALADHGPGPVFPGQGDGAVRVHLCAPLGAADLEGDLPRPKADLRQALDVEDGAQVVVAGGVVGGGLVLGGEGGGLLRLGDVRR